MSTTAKSTKSATAVYSEKFAKEMEKFFSWVQDQGYTIQAAKTGAEKKWKLDLLKSFEEPGRNKLEGFLREVMKTYVIRNGDEEVDDYKLMVKEFKDTKPKRKRTESTASVNSTDDGACVVDSKLDTSETYYLDTLDFTTEQLEMRMGKPVKAGGKGDSFRWEWRVLIGDNVYSIYDWKNEAGEFDDYQETEWYMAGMKTNAKDKAAFKAWIMGDTGKKSRTKSPKAKASKPKKQKQVSQEFDEVQESDDNVVDEAELENTIEQVSDKLSKEMERDLFGDTSDLEETESLEVDLDDLEDD